ALAVYPNLPFFVTTAQQGAPWCVNTAPLAAVRPPFPSITYDDALPAASETNNSSRCPNAKPNGVPPADAVETAVDAIPSGPTAYRSILLVAFSVTTSRVPSGVNATSAGPTAVPDSARVEPGIGVSAPSAPTLKPLMLPSPPALSTYNTLS